jgi:hypothetical protein
MTQQSASGLATWESTPTLDTQAIDRFHVFAHTFLRDTSVYGYSVKPMTIRLVPIERSGEQQCASYDAAPTVQSWDEFQQIAHKPTSTRKVRMTARRCPLPELDWEF